MDITGGDKVPAALRQGQSGQRHTRGEGHGPVKTELSDVAIGQGAVDGRHTTSPGRGLDSSASMTWTSGLQNCGLSHSNSCYSSPGTLVPQQDTLQGSCNLPKPTCRPRPEPQIRRAGLDFTVIMTSDPLRPRAPPPSPLKPHGSVVVGAMIPNTVEGQRGHATCPE